jgi:hypothetical protein
VTIQQTTRPELSPEQIATRQLIIDFKQAIKADAISLRAEKREVREFQREHGSGSAAGDQSRLVVHKLEARARLLIYGTLRGRTWDRMEPKHAETNYGLAYSIIRVWKDAKSAVPMPDQLTVFK